MHQKEKTYHRILAEYFMAQPLFFDTENRERPNARKCFEQPCQQTIAEMWKESIETLGNIWFVEAKIRSGNIDDLQKDYILFLGSHPTLKKQSHIELENQIKLRKYAQDIMKYSHDCKVYCDTSAPAGALPTPPDPLQIYSWLTDIESEKKENQLSMECKIGLHAQVKGYYSFLLHNFSALRKYGSQSCFTIQSAWNEYGLMQFRSDIKSALSEIVSYPLLLEECPERIDEKVLFESAGMIRISYDGSICITAECRILEHGHEERGSFFNNLLKGTGESILTLKCFNTKTSKLISTITKTYEYRLKLSDMAITPDGALCAIIVEAENRWNRSTCISVFDMSRNVEQCIIKAETECWNLFLLPDDQRVLLNNGLEILEISTNKNVVDLSNSPAYKFCIKNLTTTTFCTTPNGMLCAADAGEGRIQIWDVTKSTMMNSFLAHEARISCIDCSADGKYIISGGGIRKDTKSGIIFKDSDVKIWDTAGNLLHRLASDGALIKSVKISADGKWCVTVAYDGMVRHWDIQKEECIRSEYIGHIDDVNETCDLTINLNAIVYRKKGYVYFHDFTSSSDLKEGRRYGYKRKLTTMDFESAFDAFNSSAVLHIGDKNINGAWPTDTYSNIIELWNNKSSLEPYAFFHLYNEECSGITEKKIPQIEIKDLGITVDNRGAVFLPDRRNSYSEPENVSSAYIFDLSEFPPRRNIMPGTGLIKNEEGLVEYVINNRSIISIKTAKKVRELVAGEPSYLLLSPDKRFAINANKNRTKNGVLEIWDIETGEIIQTFSANTGLGYDPFFHGCHFTRDGKGICALEPYGKAYIWDILTGNHIFDRQIAQQRSKYWYLADYSSNGRLLIYDEKAYDLKSNTYMPFRHSEFDGDVVVFGPDGRNVIVKTEKGVVLVYDLVQQKRTAVYDSFNLIKEICNVSNNGVIACELEDRTLKFLTINIPSFIPLITPIRYWIIEEANKKGFWDNQITTTCSWCRFDFAVPEKLIEIINKINRSGNITPDDSPCLKLPDEAWDDPKLLFDCPKCGGKLKSNPFVVDNKGRWD